MSTRAQRRAALRNAQLSTGPRTPEGKAASSRNAVKHNLSGSTFVLLPGEDREAFESLAREYRNEWRPGTPHETFLVNQMVQARWRLDRIARMEAEVVDAMLAKFGEGQTDEGALVIADAVNPDPMRRLHRYAQDAERSYNRAVRELRAYRKEQSKTTTESAANEQIQNEPKAATAQHPIPFLGVPAANSALVTRHAPLATSHEAPPAPAAPPDRAAFQPDLRELRPPQD